MEQLEREIKKRNLICYGVTDEEEENSEALEGKVIQIFRSMEINMNFGNEIEDIRRLGRFEENRCRPIWIAFCNAKKRLEVLKNSNKLKRTKIWINRDLTKSELEERKELLRQIREARHEGYEARTRGNKAVINKKEYSLKEMKDGEYKEIDSEQQKEGRLAGRGKTTVTDRSPEENGETSARNINKKPNKDREQHKTKTVWAQSLLMGFTPGGTKEQ